LKQNLNKTVEENINLSFVANSSNQN